MRLFAFDVGNVHMGEGGGVTTLARLNGDAVAIMKHMENWGIDDYTLIY